MMETRTLSVADAAILIGFVVVCFMLHRVKRARQYKRYRASGRCAEYSFRDWYTYLDTGWWFHGY